MKKSRVLAVVMAVLMMVTLLPSMVFATAAPSGNLDGKLGNGSGGSGDWCIRDEGCDGRGRECESWVDWRWRSAQMGLGPFHSFHGFHSHILLHQIEVFDWLDPAVVG